MDRNSGFTESHLNDGTFQHILVGINTHAMLVSWSSFKLKSGMSFISSATKKFSPVRMTGHFAFQIKYALPHSNEIMKKDIILKSKLRGQETHSYFTSILSNLNKDVVDAWKKNLDIRVLKMDVKELHFAQIKDPTVLSITPDVYWSMINEKQGIFVFAMEYMDPHNFSHLNTLHDPSIWMEGDILQVLKDIASMHARYFNMISDIPENLKKHMYTYDKEVLMNLLPVWETLIQTNKSYSKDELWDKDDHQIIEKILTNFISIADIIEDSPCTLIHNDFCLRNICLRKCPVPTGKRRLCAYDWEGVCIGQPQYDLAEFLIYHITPNSNTKLWDFYVTRYLDYIQKELDKYSRFPSSSRKYLTHDTFTRVFDACVMHLLVHKFGANLNIYFPMFSLKWASQVSKNAIEYVKNISYKYSFLH